MIEPTFQLDVESRAEALALQLTIIAALEALLIHSNRRATEPNKYLPVNLKNIHAEQLANCRACMEDALSYAKRMVKL